MEQEQSPSSPLSSSYLHSFDERKREKRGVGGVALLQGHRKWTQVLPSLSGCDRKLVPLVALLQARRTFTKLEQHDFSLSGLMPGPIGSLEKLRKRWSYSNNVFCLFFWSWLLFWKDLGRSHLTHVFSACSDHLIRIQHYTSSCCGCCCCSAFLSVQIPVGCTSSGCTSSGCTSSSSGCTSTFWGCMSLGRTLCSYGCTLTSAGCTSSSSGCIFSPSCPGGASSDLYWRDQTCWRVFSTNLRQQLS